MKELGCTTPHLTDLCSTSIVLQARIIFVLQIHRWRTYFAKNYLHSLIFFRLLWCNQILSSQHNFNWSYLRTYKWLNVNHLSKIIFLNDFSKDATFMLFYSKESFWFKMPLRIWKAKWSDSNSLLQSNVLLLNLKETSVIGSNVEIIIIIFIIHLIQ